MIEAIDQRALTHWFNLRRKLWPGEADAAHRDDMNRLLARPDQFAQFIHRGADGVATGFVEASLRRDYVNGATESPVVFVEGLYVEPFARGSGIARRLVQQVADCGLAKGIGELASDALLDNRASHAVHRALGFQETERVVYFRKSLAAPPAASKDDDRP